MSELGMYEINKADIDRIEVGEFTIVRQDNDSVWIQRSDGEGGQFSDKAFEAAIMKFYAENF